MRLICPNCSAQYDVEDSVIPENGRDVQCSNCGHTWYQRPELGPLEQADEQLDAAAADDARLPDDDETDDELSSDVEKTEEVREPTPLDKEVTEILREEADRETSARTAESEGLETQPDLGLGNAPDAIDKGIEDQMARLRGLDDDLGAAAAVAATSGTRKDLLPNIEEINSTLTASADVAEEGSEQQNQEKRHRNGFRRGFAITLILFGLALLVYIFAAKIAETIPGATSLLSAYVDWVNSLRLAVDTMMLRAVEKLTAIVSMIDGAESS